jgi:hypothetical protein
VSEAASTEKKFRRGNTRIETSAGKIVKKKNFGYLQVGKKIKQNGSSRTRQSEIK